jgi:hypothetical protein
MLDKDQLQSVQALLCAAEAMPPGSARSVWLRQQSSDPWVIEEVESLLASDPPPAFLEPLLRPPAEAGAWSAASVAAAAARSFWPPARTVFSSATPPSRFSMATRLRF